eukprot:6471947-Amphidinium_carterae.1
MDRDHVGQYQRQTGPADLPITWQGLCPDGQWCISCVTAVAHVKGFRLGRSQEDSDGKVHKLVPIGRIIDNLGLTLVWSKRGGELRCPDGKKTHLLMRFITKGNMQYIYRSSIRTASQSALD